MTDLLPPTPTVEHVTTVFRRISKGDIRIPSFQRRFIWDESQIISLLESVYKGFPMGSVLLWSVRSRVLKDATFEYPIFPNVDPVFPTNFILDGMQRLSSLYGVFNYTQGVSDPRLNIWFNIETGRFQHRETIDDKDLEFSIPVRALLSPRELIEAQSRLLLTQRGDDFVDRLVDLQARFQDYMIPIVTIYRDDVSSVVDIFERINNSGTRLDTVDFMRAVTWSHEFDLNGKLDEINRSLEDYNFDLNEQTLIKLIGLELGKEPLPESLLTMRDEAAGALSDAASRVSEGLKLVAVVLRERMNVLTADFVPYEGQILVVYKALMDRGSVDLNQLVRWYWAVGFNESLRGKPDHYVARAVRSIPDLLAGKVRGVEPRLGLRPVDLIERRFIHRRALSVSVAALFSRSRPASLTDGSLIDAGEYAYDTSPHVLQPILSTAQLSKALGQRITSAKVLANLFMPSFSERLMLAVDGLDIPSRLINSPPSDEVLASQFLSRPAIELLKANAYREFLEVRAQLMVDAAKVLVEG